jgi:hypothetical protein
MLDLEFVGGSLLEVAAQVVGESQDFQPQSECKAFCVMGGEWYNKEGEPRLPRITKRELHNFIRAAHQWSLHREAVRHERELERLARLIQFSDSVSYI